MLYYLIAVIVLIIDQLSKYWIHIHFTLGESRTLIPSLLSLTHVHNTGAAWSMLEGQMWFFYIVTLAVIAVVIYYMQAHSNPPLMQTALAFILGGAMGNFIDRLIHRYVIDMIQLDFINFPIFNVADMALSLGVFLMLIYILFFDSEKQVG